MDIDRIIEETIKTPEKGNTDAAGGGNRKLLLRDKLILTEEDKAELFDIYRADAEAFIDDFVSRSQDTNADKGMYKCSLETWQACISDIGRDYFKKNKLLHDMNKRRAQGGNPLRDELMYIGLDVYETLCDRYRKQFFIYDCCRFMGIDKENMYRLNQLHANLLKRAHTAQEGSMRTALASGRSNVTAMAILLNHDYDYTRTTQVIHTNGEQIKHASDLPTLNSDMCNMTIEDKENL